MLKQRIPRAELAAKARSALQRGKTKEEICRHYKLSRTTLDRALRENPTDEERAKDPLALGSPAMGPFAPLPPDAAITFEAAVKILQGHIENDNWNPWLTAKYAKAWRIPVWRVRDCLAEAYTRARSPIDPFWVSAQLQVSIEALSYAVAYSLEHEQMKTLVQAAGRLGMIASRLIGKHVGKLTGKKTGNTPEALIALGWTPPVPDGLPFPDDFSGGEDPKETGDGE